MKNMKTCRCILFVLLASLGPVPVWASCSGSIIGANIPVVKAVADARIVYIGEVIGLRLLGRQPRHNTYARYEVAFRSITTLKGRSPATQKGTYQGVYREAEPPSSKE